MNKARSLLYCLLTVLWLAPLAPAHTADEIDDPVAVPDWAVDCYFGKEVCVDSEPRFGDERDQPCWEYESTYLCYGEVERHPESECSAAALEDWERVSTWDVTYPSIEGVSSGQMPYEWIEAWTTENETCDGDTSFGCGPILDEETISDDGYEYRWYERRCYMGPAPRCHQDDDCLISDTECVEELDGLCSVQEQTYLCDGETCPGAGAEIDTGTPPGGAGFNEVAATSATLDAVSSNMEYDDITGQIRLFGGRDVDCHAMRNNFIYMAENTGTIGSFLVAIFTSWFGPFLTAAIQAVFDDIEYSRCCKDHPDKLRFPAGLVSEGYCDADDMALAVAREHNAAVPISRGHDPDTVPTRPNERYVDTDNCFCQWKGDRTALLPMQPREGDEASCGQVCKNDSYQIKVDRYQSWCIFDSPLPRIIQEQGREQIEEMVMSGVGGSQTINQSFSFWAQEANAGWTAPADVNGNKIAAWRWDDRCQDPEFVEQVSAGDVSCPGSPTLFFASCSDPNGCGTLPMDPHYDLGTDWRVTRAPAEEYGTRTLNRYALVLGECDEGGHCDYEYHAWPIAGGGSVRIPVELRWPLEYAEADWGVYSWNHNQIQIEARTFDYGDDNARPMIRVRAPGTSDWDVIELDDPVQDLDYQIMNGPETTIAGSCDSQGGCHYQVQIEVNLELKPWFDYDEDVFKGCRVPEDPIMGCPSWAEVERVHDRQYTAHCEGFTLTEFQALDLSRMDFSAYIDTLGEHARAEFIETWGIDE